VDVLVVEVEDVVEVVNVVVLELVEVLVVDVKVLVVVVSVEVVELVVVEPGKLIFYEFVSLSCILMILVSASVVFLTERK